ncbi:MAG: AAA family ATPase [Fimbriimonadia bacterium]|nr:AAA family ATPase [Fimbriimonadia bacterium]
MAIGLLCRGHILLEDIPGVGKTTLAKTIARAIGGQFRRIQFTPDLLPSDVTGSTIYNQKSAQFEFYPGAVFANVVLADEINRATPKTQSALLEAMEERTVSADGVTHLLPDPFLVIATQNNIELIGTYPLPEAQLDRFFARLSLGYPEKEVESRILETHQMNNPLEEIGQVITPARLAELQTMVRRVYVDPSIRQYIVDIVAKTREHPQIALGASPRGSLSMMVAAQALAALQERHYTQPDDVKQMAASILSHRLMLRADAQGVVPNAEGLVNDILNQVPVPLSV